jgi:hypothetical protein
MTAPRLVRTPRRELLRHATSACWGRHHGRPQGATTSGLISLVLTKADERGGPFYTAAEVAQLYLERGREVFSRSFWRGASSVAGLADEPLASTFTLYLWC